MLAMTSPLRADDFDEMVEEGPPIGPVFAEPTEMLIGTADRLAEFEEFAYEIGGAVGFREVGTYEKHGKLDGVWRDTVIVERLL